MKNLFLIAIASFYFISCQNDDSTNQTVQPTSNTVEDSSTWGIINSKIFDQKCISCHVEGNSFAKQSNLILTKDVAYQQLINRIPNNEQAASDGLELLGNKGLESLSKSFLWEKINAQDRDHFYEDHPYYGAQMPLGPTPLTIGELSFIKEWILAGAPDSGQVANPVLLLDTSYYATAPFAALDSPGRGYQFHIGPFDVPANKDYEFFYYEPNISNEDIFISKVDIIMRAGSHHFLAYTFEENTPSQFIPQSKTFREVYDENGNYILGNLISNQYHQFVTGTQWPLMNYSFPPGVALRLPANSGLDLNSHYANKTSNIVTGEAYLNIHTLPENEVQLVAEILQLNNQSFILPANKVTTIKKTYYFNNTRNIFQLFSHAHQHMTEFKVYVVGGSRDGELVYISNDWEHPPILELSPALVIEKNNGLRLEVTYNNDEDFPLEFGLKSTDEMMILFGAYY